MQNNKNSYKDCYIYELIDPETDETRYIGKSISPRKRLNQHIYSAKNLARTHKNCWVYSLIKLGKEPIINILDMVPYSEQNYWEIWYINLYRSWGINLTNATSGGDGILAPTEDTRRKMSEANKRRTHYAFAGKKRPPEVIEKVRLSKIGFRHSKEAIDKMRGNTNATRRPVVQFNIETNKKINEFYSVMGAARSLGKTNHGNIVNCVNGKLKSAYGYKWRYKQDNNIL